MNKSTHDGVQVQHVRGHGVGDDRVPVTARSFPGRSPRRRSGDGAGHRAPRSRAGPSTAPRGWCCGRHHSRTCRRRACPATDNFVDDVRAIELLAGVGVVAQKALPAAHRWGEGRRPLPHQRPLRSGHELRIGVAARATGSEQCLVHGTRRARLGDLQRRADSHEIVPHVHHDQHGADQPIERHPQPRDRTCSRCSPDAPPPYRRRSC